MIYGPYKKKSKQIRRGKPHQVREYQHYNARPGIKDVLLRCGFILSVAALLMIICSLIYLEHTSVYRPSAPLIAVLAVLTGISMILLYLLRRHSNWKGK